MSNPQLRSNKQLTPICSLPGPVVSTLWYNGSLFMASTDRVRAISSNDSYLCEDKGGGWQKECK